VKAVRLSVEPIAIALLHPLGTWVEALECLLLQRPDVRVAMAHTSPDWVRRVVEDGVDVLVLGMSEADGFRPEDIEALRVDRPDLAVVVVSDAEDTDLFVTAFRAGARAWVSPAASVDELVRAIHGVARGQTHVPPALLTVLLESLLTGERTQKLADDALSVLSTREREILDCLATGMSRAQISVKYTLSPHTVRTHINRILTKLGVHTTLSAVSLARNAGLADRASG
jgi:DNA-binding NarL/FixJ family response regulator